jgi:hypothetical protein
LAAYFTDPANSSMADHRPNPCHGGEIAIKIIFKSLWCLVAASG